MEEATNHHLLERAKKKSILGECMMMWVAVDMTGLDAFLAKECGDRGASLFRTPGLLPGCQPHNLLRETSGADYEQRIATRG